MTKTLTEQWREGKLPRGHYYCKLYYNNFEPRIQECVQSRYDSRSCIPMSCGHKDEEVLAPVPSYEEWKCAKENLDKNGTWYTERSYKLIEKKLEIATKALKEIQEYTKEYSLPSYTGMICYKALKEMEGVK